MNPDRDLANFHTLIVTENSPEDTFAFESNYDRMVRTRFGNSTVFIKYVHGVGPKVNDFNECLNLLSKIFYDPGSITFTIKQIDDKETGKMTVISWRNIKRFNQFQKKNGSDLTLDQPNIK